MSTNGHAFQNGVASRSNGTAQAPATGRSRIFTVDEALPYTPLSSIIPFNSDIIPLPSMGLRSSTSIFSTPTEREEGRQGLESLNREAQDKYNTSQRLEQSLNRLKELLQPEGISRFKFKTAPKFSSTPEPAEQPRVALSSFARMVYEGTAVEFEHPPPEKPNRSSIVELSRKPKSLSKSRYVQKQASTSHNSNAHSYNQNTNISLQPARQIQAEKPSTPKKPAPTNVNSTPQVVISALPNSFRRNEYTPSQTPVGQSNTISIKPDMPIPHTSKPRVEILQYSQPPSTIAIKPRVEILQPSIHQPTAAPSTPIQPSIQAVSQTQKMAVVIPGPPSTFRPEEYEVLPDSPDILDHISRKRSEQDNYEDDLLRGVDQREKADKASRSLHEFLQDIFEAEDQMDVSMVADQFFASTSDGICLNIPTQTKIDLLLHKAISMARFSQIPLDDLLRLQRLCEGAMKDAGTIDLKIDETMGASEVDVLISQMSRAEMGVKAARTSLRLMSGGREEKQIYSEDIIQSALDAFKNITDNALVPIVELRSSGSSAPLFKLLVSEKSTINNLLKQCQRLLSLMAKLVGQVDLSDTVINSLEFTASQLVFVENATTEKDSVLGISKFDTLRTSSMDVLSEIFLSRPTQRKGILTEILASLARLPVTKQSARQFKLAEGGSIQHVSALIMRLIQSSANKSDDIKEQRRKKALQALNGEDNPDLQTAQLSNGQPTLTSESQAEIQSVTAIQELDSVISPLIQTAKHHAVNVVNYIVERAMTSTKTGDTPYRNLLDLFVQDFITCLSSSEWPAAELLLRFLLFKMVNLAEGKQTPAPAKNMALEILGSMAAAISELFSGARKLSISEGNGQSELGRYLGKLAEERLENRASTADMLSWSCGPFRTSLEALDAHSSNDIQLSSAMGLIKLEWASRVHTEFDLINEEDDDYKLMEKAFGALAFRLRMMITDRKWLSTEYSFESVPSPASRLAYTLTLLDSDFAKYFTRVLSILLHSMASDQATVRSKSLRSINQLLDTDPTIIDREATVVARIQECLTDQSVQVRESALNLIAKIISSRRALENANISLILDRTRDSGVGVRKRAMKLAKEIYLRNENQSVRSAVAEALMHRVDELDEGVRDLASQTMEEIWMSPFYEPTATNNHSPQFKLAIAEHVALMVKSVQGLQRNGNQSSNVLDKVLQNMLSEHSKVAEANLRVCKALVATMFETIIDNSSGDDSGSASALDALRILETFAKSNSKMFMAEQMQLLQPYIKNVRTNEQMAIFRPVVNIYRHVLPHLSRVHDDFLKSVRADLIPVINKLPTALVEDVVACVSIICETLQHFDPLNSVLTQVVKKILTFKNTDLSPEAIRFLSRLLPIAGCCAKYCDFEPQRQLLATNFPKLKNDSVPKLITDTLASFASPICPLTVRKPALEGIGMVCQSWPKNFSFVNVFTSFEQVFEEKVIALEMIVMKAFKDFLFIEEKRSEAENEALPGASTDSKAKLGVMGGSQGDGIALSIAQRFLSKIITVALASKHDGETLLATEVIASIARQGLVHPKQPGIALIALETSLNPRIAEIAFREHRKLHEKHETLFERDYMTAVHGAYDYQRDVIQDIRGATFNQGYTAKLSSMLEVLKISKVKTRKKFYDNLCSQLDVNKPRKDGNDKQLPARDQADHLAFSQFIAENMAFFDYPTVDELLSAITVMERRVFLVGTDIAHSIETDIFHISLEAPTQMDEHGQAQPATNAVNISRLKQLTASTITLSLLGEARTYLKRQYGLKTSRQDGKSKSATKDLNRAPMRIPGVNGDKFWAQVTTIMHALDSEETMMNQCRSFVELLNHDPDFRVAAEGDDDRPQTPEDDEGGNRGTPGPPGSGKSRKRKASATPMTPGARKKRGKTKVAGKRSSMERSDDEEEF